MDKSILSIIVSGVALGAVLLSWWLRYWTARRRIVRWLHEKGCEARVIRRAQVGRVDWDSQEICYYVEYSTTPRTTRRQLCVLPRGMLTDAGIFWREIGEKDLLPGDWQCFECRARIPKGETACPKCGWS